MFEDGYHYYYLCLGFLVMTGCRIEDRTPTGTRRDEDIIQHLLSRYARALSQRDWTGVRSLFWQDGNYSGPIGPGAPWPLNDQVLYLTPGAISTAWPRCSAARRALRSPSSSRCLR